MEASSETEDQNDGGSRKVGDLQEAGALEELLSRDAPVRAAADYLDFLASHPEYNRDRVKDLVAKGDALLEAAGSLEAAGVATATAWWEKNGFHMKGVFDARLEPLVDRQLLQYARTVATEGCARGTEAPRSGAGRSLTHRPGIMSIRSWPRSGKMRPRAGS